MKKWDQPLLWTLRITAGVAGAVVVLILAFLLLRSLPALEHVGVGFLSDESWSPTSEQFNVLPMLLGTIVITTGAVLLATPLAVLSAVFGRFYARPTVSRVYRRILETLAGIPSVVYGFWGLMVLVPRIAEIGPPGQSVLAGVLILALMILPTIALVTDSALEQVSNEFLDGAAAVGLSRWAIVRSIALPAARSGILTGVILGTGRALGETMAVLMVTGNVVQVPGSALDPVRTLTANIALEMAYATADHRAALFVTGLVLAVFVMALVLLVDRISLRSAHAV